MKIKQLGNNGGLGNPLQTNSAFLIDLNEDHTEYLLFDCGYNIMARLVEEEANDPYFEIAKIQHLIISHKHDDHCGNLETLIYWNYFKNNVQMKIYVADKALAQTVRDTRKIVNNFKITKVDTYSTLTIVDTARIMTLDASLDFGMYFTKAYHGAKKAIGFFINETHTQRSFFISGDTKANAKIEKESNTADLIFHDYSNWDDESKNVHACATDFEREYSEGYKKKVIKYHTGNDDFNRDWQ